MPLTPNQAQRFWSQGFFFPVTVFNEDEARDLAADLLRYEAVVECSGSEFLQLHKHFPKVHLLTTWADRIVHEARILDVVERLIGPDILAWSSGIFVRHANSGQRLAWHQDIAYFGLSNFTRAIRVWVALTATTPANGTMRYAPGSHRSGVVEHGFAGTQAEQIAQGEQIRADIDETEAVDVVLQAGQCAVHHLGLAHCSGPNRTQADRINFTVDYIAPDVSPLTTPDSALLVRGRDRHGHYEPERRPREDFGERELRQYFTSVRMRDRRILTEMQRSP